MIEDYLQTVQLVERLHRHFLDVLRAEIRSLGIDEINAVQALLLANIGDEDVVIRDLKDRGYYHGSNVSYNIKKLTELGYLAQERSEHDRRAVRLQLTGSGMAICKMVNDLQAYLTQDLQRAGMTPTGLTEANSALETLERCWTDFIRFGRR